MRLFIYITLISIAAYLQSCSGKEEKTTVSIKEKAPEKTAFKFAVVKEEQPVFTITLPGELKPYEQVNIYPKIKGFVKKIYADRGSYVRKGQLLAVLEAPEVGQQFSASSASSNTAYHKYLFSKQTYYRLKDASKTNGAVATIELERAYAQYLGDSAAYRSSRSEASASGQMQNYLRITAPFTGMITSRQVSEGALVSENGVNGAPLFQLTQQDKLRLTVAIPEKQSQALSPGMTAAFSVVDLPGKTFTARLSRNSGALDADSRSVITEFDIPNAGVLLRAGQYAKVTIRLQRMQPTLWAPAGSIVQSQQGVFVVKNEKGNSKRITVQTGVTKDSLIEVFGDLQAGDQILLKANEEIPEGTKIGHTAGGRE